MRHQVLVVSLLLSSGLGLAAACSSSTGPTVSRLGFLSRTIVPVEIELPDSIRARLSFDISVRTSGNSCMAFGGTEVTVTQQGLDFKPFDLFPEDEDGICFSDLIFFEHRASAQLTTPGIVEVRIHGRVSLDDGPRDTVIVRTIKVK